MDNNVDANACEGSIVGEFQSLNFSKTKIGTCPLSVRNLVSFPSVLQFFSLFCFPGRLIDLEFSIQNHTHGSRRRRWKTESSYEESSRSAHKRFHGHQIKREKKNCMEAAACTNRVTYTVLQYLAARTRLHRRRPPIEWS